MVWSSNMHNFSVKREHKNDWFSYTGYCQDVTYSNLFVNIKSIEVIHVSVIYTKIVNTNGKFIVQFVRFRSRGAEFYAFLLEAIF